MIINSAKTDPNKILPIRYPWARQYYKAAIANNWTPEEVSMQKDVEQWKSTRVLSEAERRLVLYNLGFFSTAESLTANNIVLAVYQHVTSPEARQYLLRQSFEEAIHTDTFIYGCDTLGLDPDEIYNMYLTIPSIKEKDAFVVELGDETLRAGLRGELDALRRCGELKGVHRIATQAHRIVPVGRNRKLPRLDAGDVQ